MTSKAPLRVAILTIFPEIFSSFFTTSLVHKAIQQNLLEVQTINIRDFADPPHYKVDDTPYGGGPGMVMLASPLFKAIRHTKQLLPTAKVILLSASGEKFVQSLAKTYSEQDQLIFICGRYEGIDQRVIDLCVDQEICVGDFVVMGGEVPAMLVIEATLRLRDGVLGNNDSVHSESFENPKLLEAPQYSKPATFEGIAVPEALLSGNHKLIEEWRNNQAEIRTKKMRPDLKRVEK